MGSCFILVRREAPSMVVKFSFLAESEALVHTPPLVREAPLPLVAAEPTCKAILALIEVLPKAQAVTLQ